MEVNGDWSGVAIKMTKTPLKKTVCDFYAINALEYSERVTWRSSVQVPIHFHYLEKSSLDILLSISFRLPQKEKSDFFGWNIPLKVHNMFFLLHICLQRILYVCKSSWSAWIEVNRNVDIYYRSVTTKLTTQILWPKVPWNHRTFICLSESFPRVLWGTSRDTSTGALMCVWENEIKLLIHEELNYPQTPSSQLIQETFMIII